MKEFIVSGYDRSGEKQQIVVIAKSAREALKKASDQIAPPRSVRPLDESNTG